MSDAERKELRDLQNRWLALPHIHRQVAMFGWDEPVAMSFAHSGQWPTFAEVRDLLHPELKSWFEDFFREGL